MSIQFGDILKHNNLVYPIVDINDVKGGLRSIATFSSPALVSEYASIPEKYKTGYSLLLETSTGTIYYLAGSDATNVNNWSSIGVGGNGYGIPNTIPKWTTSSKLGNSNITDNGDTIIISGNLQVIGTTSTINSENLLVRDPIILLAGSQSGTPMLDSGLFINRGTSTTQAFIWDESETEFKFISTTSNASTSGNVSIGTYSSVRTGALKVDSILIADGTQGVGKILISDANGLAGWTSSSYNPSGYLTASALVPYLTTAIASTTYYSLTNPSAYITASSLVPYLTIASASSPFYIKGGSTYSFDTTSDIYRTGSLNIGTGSIDSNDRFVVSSTTGSVSLVVDESGNVYNKSRGLNNTLFGYQAGPLTTGNYNTAIGYQSLLNNSSGVATFTLSNPGSGYTQSSTFSNVQLSYISGSSASTYPIVTIFVGAGGTVSSVTLVTTGTGFIDTTTIMGSNLGSSATFSISVLTILSGNYNTGVGAFSLGKNTTGYQNTALGYSSLYNNVSGYYNTAVGLQSLFNNTTGQINVAVGYLASYNNTTGQQNTAVGFRALNSNSIGSFNTAIGQRALYSNIADKNTALGPETMYSNTTGTFNTALGQESLRANIAGSYNVAVGTFALLNSESNYTIAVGRDAGRYSSVGNLIASTESLFLGYNSKSLTTSSTNEIVIGASASGNGSNTATLGSDSITKTYLKGVVYVGTASINSNDRLIVSSGGIASLIVDSNGSVYNRGKGGVVTNTVFGASALSVNTNGYNNTAIGVNALLTNTSGVRNTAIGSDVLRSSNSSSDNTALGAFTLYNNVQSENTAIGSKSLYSNTIGYSNTAIGARSLFTNITGHDNIAFGLESLYSNTGGDDNIAIGNYSLLNNMNGNFNTAIGHSTLYFNDGNNNTAVGQESLLSNTTGNNNTAVGANSLRSNKLGEQNTAIGNNSLYNNTTGIELDISNFNPGSGYVDGYYTNITLVYASGSTNYSSPPIADIDIFFGEVVNVNQTSFGSGFTNDYPGTIFTIGSYGSYTTGSGFEIGISSYRTGIRNTAVGYSSLLNNTIGSDNTAVGNNSLLSNISGFDNIALGGFTLYNNTIGYKNVAIGLESLYNNTTGTENNVIGYQSLYNNTIGNYNNAFGNSSLFYNTTGNYNNAFGKNSLNFNSSGSFNTALGSSLMSNTIGNYNTAVGNGSLNNNSSTISALVSITTGTGYVQGTYSVTLIYESGSVAIIYPTATIVVGVTGAVASVTLLTGGSGFRDYTTIMTVNNSFLGGSGTGFKIGIGSLTSGNYNTALGANSLYLNTTGSYNVALGFQSSYGNKTGNYNNAIGNQSLYSNTNGYNNTAIGYRSLFSNTTGWGSIAIGSQSLEYSTIDDRNTAMGTSTLRYNRGLWNTAIGGYGLQNASQAIRTLSATFSPGSNYSPGTYSDVRLFYSSGTSWNAPSFGEHEYPTAEIVVGAGGTVSSVTLKQRGVLIPDTTTRFTAQTGTQSYKLGTASGTGFSVGISTIGNASLNNTIGHGSMYKLGVGSDNIGIGMWAGTVIGATGSSGDLTGAEQSIFIGRFTGALNNNCINEIVIGNEAHGNGSNTITLGNDFVTKTYLKGKVQLPTIPTNSGTYSGTFSTYHILTRNDVTGEVEKIRPNVDELDPGVLTINLAYLTSTYPTATAGFKIYQHRPGFPSLIYEKTASIWIQYQANVVT